MAIVATYEQGACTCYIHDDLYRDVPADEIKRRIEKAKSYAAEISTRAQLRRIEQGLPQFPDEYFEEVNTGIV